MVTWLFSARHSLVSNYRFPSGDAIGPDLISYYSRKHLRKLEIPTWRNVHACVCLPGTAHTLRCAVFARPSTCATRRRAASSRVSVSASVSLSRCSPFLSLLVRRQRASQVHHTSHVTSLTSSMLLCRDPWRQRCATTLRYVRVCQTQPLLFP